MPRDSCIFVRAVVLTGEAGDILAPATPWEGQVEGETGWLTYWPAGRAERPNVFVQCRALTTATLTGGRAAFFAQGPSARIAQIQALATKSWDGLAALRVDATAAAVAVRAAWVGESVGTLRHRVAGYGDTNGESRIQEDEV